MNNKLKTLAFVTAGLVVGAALGRVKKSNKTNGSHLEQKKKDNSQKPKTVNFERWSSFNEKGNKVYHGHDGPINPKHGDIWIKPTIGGIGHELVRY